MIPLRGGKSCPGFNSGRDCEGAGPHGQWGQGLFVSITTPLPSLFFLLEDPLLSSIISNFEPLMSEFQLCLRLIWYFLLLLPCSPSFFWSVWAWGEVNTGKWRCHEVVTNRRIVHTKLEMKVYVKEMPAVAIRMLIPQIGVNINLFLSFCYLLV